MNLKHTGCVSFLAFFILNDLWTVWFRFVYGMYACFLHTEALSRKCERQKLT